MKERGKFIVFEGSGRCGKTTQVEYAKNLLQANGINTISTREPGGIESSEKIRELVFELKREKLINAEGQMVLFFGARFLWVDGIIKPNLDQGINVLSDRCYPATGAFQGYAERGNMDNILSIADIVMGDYKPDAVILLDISLDEYIKRRKGNTEGDPFDEEELDYSNRVIAGYREMAQSSWGDLNWFIVNGEQSVELVSEEIRTVLGDIFVCELNP